MKVPPSINQFKRTLDKNQASELFKLLVKYQPETKDAKQNRLEDAAKATAAGEATPTSPPPPTLKYGLKHVTTLIEQKKAKLVVIPHDVDPIELVLWVPALCRKMGIPFAIVKGKSRLGRYPRQPPVPPYVSPLSTTTILLLLPLLLGTLTHKKTCSAICLTTVNKEDENKLSTLSENFKAQFNDNVERKWGGNISHTTQR